ncbi:hypothetical protein IT415_00390 [bacterium]|nr:hypothetical protein [bacterium]
MKQYHTLITLIIAGLLTILFVVGYGIMVTPNDKQAKLYDQQREKDFTKLKSSIQTYYTSKRELPKTLVSLTQEDGSGGSDLSGNAFLDGLLGSFAGLSIRDPQTNKEYEYKYDNQSSKEYQLCAKFAKSNEEGDKKIKPTPTPSYLRKTTQSIVVKHGAGDQCIKFTISEQKTDDDYIPFIQTAPRSDDAELSPEEEQRLSQELGDQPKSSPTPKITPAF